MSRIPKFKSIAEESEFWDAHDVTEFLDEFEPVSGHFIDRRPPKKAVSMRFDPYVILLAKRLARDLDMGYQTFLRMLVMEGLQQRLAAYRELRRTREEESAEMVSSSR